jgi:hypothetical protein
MYYNQGLDSLGTNYGSNPFRNYNAATPVNPLNPEIGYEFTNGVQTTTMSVNLNASYELRENLFIDLGATYRKMSYDDAVAPDFTTNYFYGGLRLNISRRDYDFY